MSFPTTLDSFTTHATGDTISASDINDIQTAVIALETKMGIDSSAVTSSLDYKINSTSSIDVGHKHSLSVSIADVVITSPANGELLTYDSGTGKWVNGNATGVSDASTTVKGVTKMSVAPAVASTPIAVGDNDPRVPTQSENDALVGSSGSPSSSNKYITEDDVSNSAVSGKVVRASGTALPALDGSALTKIQTHTRLAGYSPAGNTTENTVLSTTITGGLMSSSGMIRLRVPILFVTNATAETWTIRLKFGGSTLSTITISSGAVGGGTNSNMHGVLEGWIINNSATNSQNVGFYAFAGNDLPASTNLAILTITQPADTTSAVDTTSDQTLAVTVQRSNGGGGSGTFYQSIVEIDYK